MWITDGVLTMKRNCGSIISRKSRFQFNLFCSAVILSLSKDDYGKNASTGSALHQTDEDAPKKYFPSIGAILQSPT